MTKYRIFKDGDNYYPQRRWMFIWCNMQGMDEMDIACNSEEDAQQIIDDDIWIEQSFKEWK